MARKVEKAWGLDQVALLRVAFHSLDADRVGVVHDPHTFRKVLINNSLTQEMLAGSEVLDLLESEFGPRIVSTDHPKKTGGSPIREEDMIGGCTSTVRHHRISKVIFPVPWEELVALCLTNPASGNHFERSWLELRVRPLAAGKQANGRARDA